MNAAVTESILCLIESLTPTSGDARFVRIRELAAEDEAPVMERVVSVEWDGNPTRIFETGTRRYRESGAIVVRYDSEARPLALEKRMAEDRSQILDTLSHADIAGCVALVALPGGSSINRSNPRFPTVRLRFSVDYRL